MLWKSVLLFTLCLLFLLADTGFSATGSKERDAELAEAAYSAGMEMVEKGAFDPAVDLFYKALSLKKDKRYYIALGHAQRDVDQRKLAFYSYLRAMKMIDESDEDYEGLLVLLVSLGVDLCKVEEIEEYLPRLKDRDPSLARSATERLYIERARAALAKEQFARAYRNFSKARRYASDDRVALRGCVRALDGAAKRFSEAKRYEKSLQLLLRLYRLRPSEDLKVRIQGAFLRAGKPKSYKAKVEELLSP